MQCTSPITIKNGKFPCGHCLACRIAKSREWSARLIHELSYWDKSVFVTLTYSDLFLPKDLSLKKKDLQNFFKRLRKYSNTKLKYFACGEYGEKIKYNSGLGRPHYHAIIFGLSNSKEDTEYVKDAWRFCDWSMFKSNKAFGTVTYDSCRYVSDYIFKKYNKELAEDVYLSKGLEIPFKVCSQGLGLRFCLDNKENLISNFGFTLHGSKMALPRYYVEKLDLQLEEQNELHFNQWKKYAELHNVHISDIAELIDEHNKQRNLNLLRRSNLFHKGEL